MTTSICMSTPVLRKPGSRLDDSSRNTTTTAHINRLATEHPLSSIFQKGTLHCTLLQLSEISVTRILLKPKNQCLDIGVHFTTAHPLDAVDGTHEELMDVQLTPCLSVEIPFVLPVIELKFRTSISAWGSMLDSETCI